MRMGARGYRMVNGLILVLSMLGGPLVVSRMNWPAQDGGWGGALLIAAAAATAVFCFLTLAQTFSADSASWFRPSLSRPPFQFNQPAQQMYMGALVLLAVAAGGLLGKPWVDGGDAWMLFLCMGGGSLVGVLVTVVMLGKHMRCADTPRRKRP